MNALAPITHGELIDRAVLVAELQRAADNMTGLERLNPEQAAIADLIASGIRAAIVIVQQQPAQRKAMLDRYIRCFCGRSWREVCNYARVELKPSFLLSEKPSRPGLRHGLRVQHRRDFP